LNNKQQYTQPWKGADSPTMIGTHFPPFILVEGIPNFRDLGGYPISTHTDAGLLSVRRNLIFRCAEPSRITPAGAQTLRTLGITTLFDLRSRPETEKQSARAPVVHIDGIRREFAPVFADKDYSPESIALRYKDYASSGTEGFTRAYAAVLKNAPSSYRRVFMHIRDKPEEACVIHCTAGKDRTGVLAALILVLAGVDERTVADEYALTEIGLAPLRPIILQHLIDQPALEGNREGAMNMVSAK